MKLRKRLTSETADRQLFFFFFNVLLELENISTMGITFYNGKWIFRQARKAGDEEKASSLFQFWIVNAYAITLFCRVEESEDILDKQLVGW